MSQNLKGTAARQTQFGLKTERATAIVPQTATASIFTTSARIIVTGLMGLVTAAGTATDPLLKLRSTPTVGTITDLCAVVAAFTTSAVGTILTIDGNPATAMTASTGTGQILDDRGVIIPAGAIQLACGASNTTLSIAWTLLWVPLDDGAFVTAV